MQTHQQADSLRFAQIQSSINNKSILSISSNAVKSNLKSKFTYFEDTLSLIEQQTKQLVQDTHKTLRKCEQMKVSSGQQMVQEFTLLCRNQIKMFEKEFLINKDKSQQKIKQLWEGCRNLMTNSEHLKNTIRQAQNRIEKVQVTLGFYNGEDKMNNF